MNKLLRVLKKVRSEKDTLARLSVGKRNAILGILAKTLFRAKRQILAANRRDLKKLGQGNVIWRDRLELNSSRLRAMTASLVAIAKLPDPLHRPLETRRLPNGLVLKKIPVPLGVVGVIYESRPNVTIDLAALAIKSGNALVLKGGRESYETNKVLVRLIRQTLQAFRVSPNVIYLIDPLSEWEKELFTAQGLLDVLIPRGGKGLIEFVRKNAKIPVIETGAGVCHTFVDEKINFPQAVKIIINAKTQRPTVCNSLDTLVVHRKALQGLLPALVPGLVRFGVEIRADAPALSILKKFYPANLLRPAVKSDFGHEFLSLRLAIKTVSSFLAGLRFVKKMTSGHSEAILTKNRRHAQEFLREIDAATVYHNASTRFTDGGEFGMGAEVGISTQKLHARGPMGAEALTSYKWIVLGKGQVRK